MSSKRYELCDHEVHAVMTATMKKYHPALVKAQVTVSCVFAFGPRDDETGELKGPAVVHNGVACAAVTRIIPIKLRAQGMADVEIEIDGDQWDDWTLPERVALFDHELQHNQVKLEGDAENPRFEIDTCGRPVIKTRRHDRQFGWFDDVAKRQGMDSFEVKQAYEIIAATGQLYFPFSIMGGARVDEKQTKRRPRNGGSRLEYSVDLSELGTDEREEHDHDVDSAAAMHGRSSPAEGGAS